MSKTATVFTTVVLLALLGLYVVEESRTQNASIVQEFDDSCGFTDDFSQFLKDNSIV